jgi:sarcosine oxidase subunit beta
LVTPAFAAAAKRLGARVWEETKVTGVEIDEGKVVGVIATNAEGEWTIDTPLVLHTAGPWSPEIGAQLGIHIPITPSRTIIAKTEPIAPLFTEFISSHDTEIFARPDKAGQIHVGAVAQPLGIFDECTEDDIHAFVERRVKLIPMLGEVDIAEVWSGTLAMTPDRQPIMGPVDGLAGYLLATGFSGHGFCLGPITGKVMAEQIIDGAPSIDLSAFRLARFAEAGSDAEEPIAPKMIAG